jgi:hypothetical protein
MIRILILALAWAWAGSALAYTRWWEIYNGECVSAGDGSPAEIFEAAKAKGDRPKIIDRGDEVLVLTGYTTEPVCHGGLKICFRGKWQYFRTLEACQESAQAATAAAQAEKEKLDKYR